jgi:SPP1 gp7 family putative phage head morphogenesis protein
MENKKTQAYWVNRLDEIFSHLDEMDLDYFYELEAIYAKHQKLVEKELFAFYQRYATDNEITLAAAKQRLTRVDLSDYKDNAKTYRQQAKDDKDTELLDRLNEQYSSSKATRLEALNLNLTYLVGTMNKELQTSLYGYLKQVAQYAYKKIRFGNSSSTLNEPTLKEMLQQKWNAGNYSSRIWGNTDTLVDDLKTAMERGFIRGDNPVVVARELRKKYNVAKARAETLTRTEGTFIANSATLRRYREAGLTKYQYLAHLDSRTTEICRQLNDTVYLIKDYQPGLNAPPMHPNCRSAIVPVDAELSGKSINGNDI